MELGGEDNDVPSQPACTAPVVEHPASASSLDYYKGWIAELADLESLPTVYIQSTAYQFTHQQVMPALTKQPAQPYSQEILPFFFPGHATTLFVTRLSTSSREKDSSAHAYKQTTVDTVLLKAQTRIFINTKLLINCLINNAFLSELFVPLTSQASIFSLRSDSSNHLMCPQSNRPPMDSCLC